MKTQKTDMKGFLRVGLFGILMCILLVSSSYAQSEISPANLQPASEITTYCFENPEGGGSPLNPSCEKMIEDFDQYQYIYTDENSPTTFFTSFDIKGSPGTQYFSVTPGSQTYYLKAASTIDSSGGPNPFSGKSRCSPPFSFTSLCNIIEGEGGDSYIDWDVSAYHKFSISEDISGNPVSYSLSSQDYVKERTSASCFLDDLTNGCQRFEFDFSTNQASSNYLSPGLYKLRYEYGYVPAYTGPTTASPENLQTGNPDDGRVYTTFDYILEVTDFDGSPPLISCSGTEPSGVQFSKGTGAYRVDDPSAKPLFWSYTQSTSPGVCEYTCAAGYAWDGLTSTCVPGTACGGNEPIDSFVTIGHGYYSGSAKSWNHIGVGQSPGECEFSCDRNSVYNPGSNRCEELNCEFDATEGNLKGFFRVYTEPSCNTIKGSDWDCFTDIYLFNQSFSDKPVLYDLTSNSVRCPGYAIAFCSIDPSLVFTSFIKNQNASFVDDFPSLSSMEAVSPSSNTYLDSEFTIGEFKGVFDFPAETFTTSSATEKVIGYEVCSEPVNLPSDIPNETTCVAYDYNAYQNNRYNSGFFPSEDAFSAIKSDGSVVTWGSTIPGSFNDFNDFTLNLKDVISVHSTSGLDESSSGAFAALHENGTVTTWGFGSGSDSSSVQSQLTDVVKIFSNRYAFAALKSDGSVIVWGDSSNGGVFAVCLGNTCANYFSSPTDVVNIVSTEGAFAALKSDGSVVTWGNLRFGGDSSNVQTELQSGVEEVVATLTEFAARTDTGNVVYWGDSYRLPPGDINPSAYESKLYDVIKLAASSSSFSALRNDGVVISFGFTDESLYRFNSEIPYSWYSDFPIDNAIYYAPDSPVIDVFTNHDATVMLLDNGSIAVFGSDNGGGLGVFDSSLSSLSPIDQSLFQNIDTIYSGAGAFAALLEDGSVVTWGLDYQGGNSSLVSTQLSSGVRTIVSNKEGFAAIKDDKTVVVWGGELPSSALQSELIDVEHIFTTINAFAALKSDGSVVVWGEGPEADISLVQSVLTDVVAINAGGICAAPTTPFLDSINATFYLTASYNGDKIAQSEYREIEFLGNSGASINGFCSLSQEDICNLGIANQTSGVLDNLTHYKWFCEGLNGGNRDECELLKPVDGGWSDWSDWSDCSKDCDGGTRTRTRTCTNPSPQSGGADCVGPDTENEPCNEQSCPASCGPCTCSKALTEFECNVPGDPNFGKTCRASSCTTPAKGDCFLSDIGSEVIENSCTSSQTLRLYSLGQCEDIANCDSCVYFSSSCDNFYWG